MPHSSSRFVTNLGAKLATKSRHICLFFGAGAAKACGLPDVWSLQNGVLASLEEPYRALFEKQLSRRSLEQALGRIRRIAALLKDSDADVAKPSIDGLSTEMAG